MEAVMLSIIRSLVFIFALSLFGLAFFTGVSVNEIEVPPVELVEFQEGPEVFVPVVEISEREFDNLLAVNIPITRISEESFEEELLVSVPVYYYDLAGVVVEIGDEQVASVCSVEWTSSQTIEEVVC
jgi:hypothetical protein